MEAQVQAFFKYEKTMLDLQQHGKSLTYVRVAQRAVIEHTRGTFERLRACIWAIESVCPPFKSLFKNYELQREIFFMVYSLRPSQVLEPPEFERLWEEIMNDDYEHLLTEILVRGEVKLKDLFKGFLKIADLEVHVFLYYSQLELSLGLRRQLISRVEANAPAKQIDLQKWNQVAITTLAIFPSHLMQPWRTELARLHNSMAITPLCSQLWTQHQNEWLSPNT